jgi:outer membrane receptor for ferrienterochelin and colicin
VKSSTTVANITTVDFGDPLIKSERVIDFELGGNYQRENYAFDLNLYYMKFTDMIVAEGGVTDGIANSLNVDGVVHSGVEFSGVMKLNQMFSINGNFAYNHNRITDFIQTFNYEFDTLDAGGNPVTNIESYDVDLDGKKVSRFPELLGNIIVNYQADLFELTYYGNFIGRQYSELINIDELSIDPVFVSSIGAKIRLGNFINMGNVSLSLKVENLFSQKYESAVAYAENYAYRLPGSTAVVDGWSTYYVASELSFFAQLKVDMF